MDGWMDGWMNRQTDTLIRNETDKTDSNWLGEKFEELCIQKSTATEEALMYLGSVVAGHFFNRKTSINQ